MCFEWVSYSTLFWKQEDDIVSLWWQLNSVLLLKHQSLYFGLRLKGDNFRYFVEKNFKIVFFCTRTFLAKLEDLWQRVSLIPPGSQDSEDDLKKKKNRRQKRAYIHIFGAEKSEITLMWREWKGKLNAKCASRR